MKYAIVTEPNEILRRVSEPVPLEEITAPEFQRLIDDMIETMYDANGIGIAAPQIGLNRRIIIVETGKRRPIAYINPEITRKSIRTVESEEGCLSVPGIYGIVKRHRGVTANAYDRTGKKITVKSASLVAIILQHEIDHLNGILFIDKASNVHPITEYSNPRI